MGKHAGTPATDFLAKHGVAYTEHFYDYVEHGGTAVSSSALAPSSHASRSAQRIWYLL